MDQKLSYIINGILNATISILQFVGDLERYNRELNVEQFTELQKQIDKLGSNKTLEDLLLKKCTTKD